MAIQHRKFKLSDTRQQWTKGRESTLKGEPVRLNPQVANTYAEAVTSEVYKMHLDVSGQIERLFNSATAKNSIQKTETIAMDGVDTVVVLSDWIVDIPGIAMDASISSMARILTNKLVDKWTKRFNTFGKSWTKNMIGYVETQSAKDLGRSMNKLSGGLTIKTDQISEATRDKILASADQSASLITTIGPSYATEVKEAVARAITDDSQSFTKLKDNIHSMLQSQYKKHKNKAFNVAKDQMRKSYTAVTASRMKDLGVNQYIWKWAGGSKKPRDYHRFVLSGQTFSLNDPPIIDQSSGVRGKPGDAYFCSCYMIPVINFDNKT